MINLSKALLIVFILFAVSCEKVPTSDTIDDTIIFGTVTDSKTNLPMQGVSILIINVGDGVPIAYNDTIYVTQTDADGKFQLQQKLYPPGPNGGGTYFSAHKDNYYDNSFGVKIGAVNECNIKLVKDGFLIVHIKNTTPYDNSDSFYFSLQPNDGHTNQFHFYGTSIDTTLTIKAIPNYTNSIGWEAQINGVITSSNENVYFNSGDTIYRTILY